MTVSELIEKIENYPNAAVSIYMDGAKTDNVYLDYASDHEILIAQK